VPILAQNAIESPKFLDKKWRVTREVYSLQITQTRESGCASGVAAKKGGPHPWSFEFESNIIDVSE
jgi:hypothetical protein